MHGGGGGGGYFPRDEDIDTRTIGSAYDRYLQSVVLFLLLLLLDSCFEHSCFLFLLT